MSVHISKSGSGGNHHFSLGTSIAAAESISSVISLGAVWLVGKNPQMIAPAKEFLASHIFYPVMAKRASHASDQADPENIMEKAERKASVLLKGMVMVGTSFASHLPIQMLLEGQYDIKELRKVVLGKSLGLATAMGTLMLINHIKPGTIGQIEDRLCKDLFDCNENTSKEACEAKKETKEMCKLMMVDIPSSIIAGVVNYQLTKRLR
jgi:hypothetical protein